MKTIRRAVSGLALLALCALALRGWLAPANAAAWVALASLCG